MTDTPLLLSIDLGTTACKAFVVTADGEIVGQAGRDYPLIKLGPTEIEQHAQDWWRVASMSARKAIAMSGRSGREVRALSISSQGISIVPVSDTGAVIRPAITWLDTRAAEQTEKIVSSIDAQALFQLTGKRPSSFYSLPKMMWLAEHEPQTVEKTHKFLLPHDYLIYRLTGCFVTDQSLASGTMAHDVTKLDWSSEMLDIAGVSADMLPDLTWAGSPVCRILEESAETLGVSREAVVACGGQDQKCAALSVGAKRGVVTVSLGTASAISAVTDSPVLDSRRRLPCFPFVTRDTWDLEGVISTAGGALKWLKDAFFSGGYDALDHLAEPSFEGTANLFFYPHLAGAGSPVWDSDFPGVLYGLALSTEPGDIVRAVLEGVAYQIRSNVEAVAELGVDVQCVKVFGGGAKSRFWLQIIADVLGRETAVPPSPEAAAMGGCVLAGVGCGIYKDAAQGSEVFARGQTVLEPDPHRSRQYDERYARYIEIESRLTGAK